MFLELDGHGPRYAQLTRALKAAILTGRLTAGMRLPSTRELAQELELSRTTVQAAYGQLYAEGLVKSRAGSGSHVAELHLVRHKPPSRYALRARIEKEKKQFWSHADARYNLLPCASLANPDLASLWGRELARAARHTALEDSNPQGLPALRQQICDYLARRRGIFASPHDVLITSGAQQAFALTARALLNEGDTVVMEEPHYLGTRSVFVAHGATIYPVGTDDDGLVCSDLPAKTPRLVCVTPSHQFPGGDVLSLPRRLELLRYASNHRCWILEDDHDGEFRYDNQRLAALRSLDEEDRVIYVGNFSKVVFNAMRLGYMVMPAALREDFIAVKYLCDLACPIIEQAALAHFMETGGFERHLRLALKELQLRREALIDGLRQHAGDRLHIVDAPVGTHVAAWLNGYDHASAEMLIARARNAGLGLYSMAPHYSEPPPRPGFLFGFGRLSTTALREAARLVGQCLDEIDACEHPVQAG